MHAVLTASLALVAVATRASTLYRSELAPPPDERTPAARPPARQDTPLRALDSLWARMYATHDTAAAEHLYADHLVFRSANGTLKSKQDELRDVRPAPGLVMEFFRTEPTSVRAAGDSGYVAGVAWWRFMMRGQPREIRRTYETTYARGGPLGWQIVRVQMGGAP